MNSNEESQNNSQEKLLKLICYSKNEVPESYDANSYLEIVDKVDKNKINWLQINDFSSPELDRIAEDFNIHYLIVEDIRNAEHLPKLDDNDENMFFTLKFLRKMNGNGNIEHQHIAFVLGSYFVISSQKFPTNLFLPIAELIKSDKGKIRKKGIEYLLYLLIDHVVDNYYLIIEDIREQIENLEDEIIEHTDKNYTKKIHHVKKQLNTTRKFLFPAREAINELKMEDSNLLDRTNDIYFNDIYDHIEHLISLSESFRETVTSLIELNASNLSNKMNQVMQRLTVVSTVFIPLTFIVGMYGMNFKHMPELAWEYSYPILLVFMLLVASFILLYMKHKKWF